MYVCMYVCMYVKFEEAGIVTRSLLDMSTRVTYEEFASRFPDVVVVSILRVF